MVNFLLGVFVGVIVAFGFPYVVTAVEKLLNKPKV